MSSTKIDFNANRIARISDIADLAEILFPGNRNQQHCFTAVWFSLKWAGHNLVPNLDAIAREHDITPRTLERVRAKLRRVGLIDHVSRFNARFGYREGWVLSTRFHRSLHQLAEQCERLADPNASSIEKDELLLSMARARRDIRHPGPAGPVRSADAIVRGGA